MKEFFAFAGGAIVVALSVAVLVVVKKFYDDEARSRAIRERDFWDIQK